jgi:RHS repeat-associated protein
MAVRENGAIGFEARRGGTLLKKASFRYDAFNRRVAAFADTDGDASDDVVTYQVYGGQAAWQMLGEYDGAGDTANPLRSFVYGLYIDEVVSMRDHASDDDYFYHQDDLFSVYALTDADGVVVERYDYGDYGQVSIMAGDGTPRAESQYDNRHAFTGRLLVPGLTLDDGSQILEYRHRYMHTASGRFVQRDPLGYIGGSNLLAYTRSNPMRYYDPLGLQALPPAPIPFTQPLAPGWKVWAAGKNLAKKRAACTLCHSHIALLGCPPFGRRTTPSAKPFESFALCGPRFFKVWPKIIEWHTSCSCDRSGVVYAEVFDESTQTFGWVRCN